MSVSAPPPIATDPPPEPVPAGSPTPARDDVQATANETLDRTLTGLITGIPIAAFFVAVWQLWGGLLRWHDVVVFAIVYFFSATGITIGFHRMLTHRSFKSGPAVRGFFAICGSIAIEGPVISWVADHRKHHAFSDQEGDPHSPHVDHGHGVSGAVKGLLHAHVGWLFIHDQRGARERFTRDLIDDPVVSFVDKTFILWSLLGLAIPFGLGYAFGGTLDAALTATLWGGAVRIFLLHHVTYSINSLCHFFGRRRFATGDESRNLAWLAPFSMGEAWHNNHHAFPTSAYHGLGRRELDMSGLTISALEKAGLVWDVQRPTPERMAAKAVPE